MGCGCLSSEAIQTEDFIKEIMPDKISKMIDNNNKDESVRYYEVMSNYIEFYENSFNKFEKGNHIYLVETDFFKNNFKELSIDLNTEKIDLIVLKDKILSKKLKFPKYKKMKFIYSEKDVQNITSNIEILNDEILGYLISDSKEYINKEVKCKIKQNNEIDVILENTTITIKKEKFNINIIKKDNDEKSNSTNFSFQNQTVNNQLFSDLSKIQINPQEQKTQKKIINDSNCINEINKNNDEISSKNSDLISNNFNVQMNKDLISISNISDDLKYTVIGKPLDNSIYKDENSLLIAKYELYNEYYKKFFEELKNIDKLLSGTIEPEYHYDDYVIINKSYFNKLIKLFEPMSIYNNESYIIDSYDKLTKIENLEININQFNDRLRKLKTTPPQLEVESINNSKYKYPKKFLLIKKDLLVNFHIKERNFKLNIFRLLFGEKYLFIKLKKSVIVCSKEDLFFSVNYVFICFHRKYFETELVPNIQNKGGFDYFFNKIGFDVSKNDVFRHISEEGTLSEIYLINYKEDIKVEYLKYIILSLSNITQLTDNLLNHVNTDKRIASLFIDFLRMKQENFDYKTYINIINDMLKYIKNYEIDTNLNNFQILLDIILNNLHKELNTKIIKEDEYPSESKDKNYVINLFKKNYESQNESIIKKLFFGLALTTIIPSCNCKEKNYRCELVQYIYINQENLNESNNLEDFLNNWGKSKINKYHCKKCNIYCEAESFKELKEYPEILIIILNNEIGENKKSIKFPQILNIQKFLYKYKISNIISSQSKKNNFNIISKNKNDEWIVKDKDGKEKTDIKDIKTYFKYPMFYFTKNQKKMIIKLRKTIQKLNLIDIL